LVPQKQKEQHKRGVAGKKKSQTPTHPEKKKKGKKEK
jgi:hypothetical protein